MSPRTVTAVPVQPLPAQRRPRWNTRAGECRHACPAGNPCTCTDHDHRYHICSDARCWCHTASRYDHPEES